MTIIMPRSHHLLLLLAVLLLLLPSGTASGKIDQVFYIYETSETSEPPYIAAAIRQLDDLGLDARAFDADRDNANLQPAIAAARAAGLPSLVLLSDYSVVRAIEPPADVEGFLEAVN